MVLDVSLLNTQRYKVWIRVKWNNPGKGVAPSPTPWCNSYRKWKPSSRPQLRLPTYDVDYFQKNREDGKEEQVTYYT